jgi:hypothetical protein
MKPSITLLSLAGVASFVLTSCVTTSSLQSLTPSQIEARIIKENRVGGAALGALTGAAVGYFAGGQSAEGAIIGAIGGAAVGHQIGNKVGNNKVANLQGARLEGERLARLVSEARAYNSYITNYNSKLRSQIARIEATTGKQRAALAAVEAQRAKQSLMSVNQTLNQRSTALQQQSFSNSSGYRSEYNALQKRRDELKSSVEQLEKLSKTTVG